MIAPIKRILVSCILAYIICLLSFLIIKKEIDRYKKHTTSRLTEIFCNKTNYDVLFLGSSRTHLIINPAIIDSICKVNSYNAGMEGANLYEFDMVLKAYLENHPSPQWLVLTIDLHSFTTLRKRFISSDLF